ncbi:MAG: YCF48-related protein [Ferruginibacter sp.]|nr:oxidoreductase [Ferruginibacter sp.]
MYRRITLLSLTFVVAITNAQSVKILTSGTKSSLRGLSVVSEKIIWASGSNGKIAKSLDAGNTWEWFTVPGFEKTEFRDIEAFDENEAIIMAIDSPAIILKTLNGGKNWRQVYRNDTKGMFLDAMYFSNTENGIVIGDPIKSEFFIAKTKDEGETWQEENYYRRPLADSGEACFASSGTNICVLQNKEIVFVSGGLSSHFYKNNVAFKIPILQGKESTGANSIASKNNKFMIIVGGDFTTKDETVKNCIITKDAGNNWYIPTNPPTGYRSCIEYITAKKWITCGLNGVDITYNDGNDFNNISKESFHTCKRAKKGNAVYLVGNNGKIGVLLL